MIYQDNILYVDIDKLIHFYEPTNKHLKKIRVYLGTINDDEFDVTVETILNLPIDEQNKVRDYIKSIFKS